MSRENRAEKAAETLPLELRSTLEAVYPQLRRIARSFLARERATHTLQPTALTNEVVARLLKRELAGEDRAAILASGIREMQTILIDSGRKHQLRRANEASFSQDGASGADSLEDLIHLQLCLERLGQVDPRARQVIELRFFTGLSIPETAQFLEISARAVNEDWEFARCWLAQNWAEI